MSGGEPSSIKRITPCAADFLRFPHERAQTTCLFYRGKDVKAVRQALYRAYRPKTFDEVVGQDAITAILKSEMAAGRPSHAYLFVGSRGTGKTTCAKLVAKAVNCEHLKGGNPCNECAACRGVDDGSLLDVVEIDAASNNGVDSIRDLRDEAVFTPAAAKYRVYIIDEVHMLSTNAFNALLKTLEEPPPHVIFVLATTEVHKVLPTIISRCQRFDFRRIEPDVIAGRLQAVAAQEGFALTDDAARLIARLSDGGMRDALSLLDVCAADAETVTAETVAAAAGLAGRGHLLDLCDRIFAGDTAGVLTQFAALTAKSLEPQRLCEQLTGHLRDLMLVKTVDRPAELLGCLPSELPALQKQADAIALSDLLADLSTLQEAAARMGKTASKRAELELALVLLTEPTVRTGAAALLQRIERLEKAVRNGWAPAEASGADRPEAPADPPARESATGGCDASISQERPAERVSPKAEAPFPAPETQSKPTAPRAAAGPAPFRPWPQVLEEIGAQNANTAGMLTGTRAYFDGRRVLIDIPNDTVRGMLNANEGMKACIHRALLAVTGQDYPLGPYQAIERPAESGDPLERLIAALPDDEHIQIH